MRDRQLTALLVGFLARNGDAPEVVLEAAAFAVAPMGDVSQQSGQSVLAVHARSFLEVSNSLIGQLGSVLVLSIRVRLVIFLAIGSTKTVPTSAHLKGKAASATGDFVIRGLERRSGIVLRP